MSKPISKALSKAASKAKRPSAGAKRASARSAASAAPKARAQSSSARSRSAPQADTAASASQADISRELDEILPEGKLYYRIGEVSKITGVKAYVLRYWESEFRWMAPQKSRSKQRLYRRKDIETILLIRTLLYEERYTIAGARQRLRELGAGKSSAAAKSRRAAAASESPAAQEIHAESGTASPGSGDSDSRARFQQIREELIAIRALL